MLIQASSRLSGPVHSVEPYFSNKTQILSLAATDAFHEKSFGKDEAAFVMEVLQTEIDRMRTHKNAQKRKYLKSIRHLNHVHGVLPPSMFLKGLVRESPTAVAGGGFADIWTGRLGKQRVCIKVLRFFQQGSDREGLLKALSKEVLLWRQLNHPNILPFLGINTELFSPSFCIVSPWMSNGDIMSYARNSSLDLSTKLEHTIQIAEGLFYLHGLDPPVVHGDIKGANILISDERRCCLADFGLSVLDTQSMNPAHTASVQGSLRWLAPEFINPTPMPIQGRLTSRDIYAFGCTVFEILTGQPPFSHHNLDISVAIDVLKGVRPVLPPLVIPKEDVFKSICAMLDSCWTEEIKHRPDARDVLDFLKHVLNLLRYPEQELELFSLLPVLNAAEIAPKTSGEQDCLFDDDNASSTQQLSASKALNPLPTFIDSDTSTNGEASNGVSFATTAAMVSEIPTDPQPSPFPALTLSNARYQSQRPDTLDHPQSSFAATPTSQHTRALKEERQLKHVESANENSPVARTKPRSGSSIKDPEGKAHAVQSTPSPFFGASSRTYTVVPRLRPGHYPFQLHTPTSRELQSSNPSQSGRSYCLTTRKDDDTAVLDIFPPFNEELDDDDEDDQIVWDPRPSAVSDTASSLANMSPFAQIRGVQFRGEGALDESSDEEDAPPVPEPWAPGTVIKGEPFAGSGNIEFSGGSEFITASQGNKSHHHDPSSHTFSTAHSQSRHDGPLMEGFSSAMFPNARDFCMDNTGFINNSEFHNIQYNSYHGLHDGLSNLFNSLGDSESDVDECDDEEIAPRGGIKFGMPRGSGNLFSFSMSTDSTDVISSLSLPPPIPASMQSSGRGLSSANTSRSTAFNHRDGGVSEGNEATAKEEVNTPPPNQHEVLQNFFQSLLTSKQTGGTENKDPSLRTSALDPGKIQRTVGSSSSIYYDDDRAGSSFGSPTLPTEMYSGEPSTLIPSEDEAFQVPRTSPISPPWLEASQNGLFRSNSAGRIQAMHKLTGGTNSYNSSSSALDSGKPNGTDMVPGGKRAGAFELLRKMSLVRAAKDTEYETRKEGSSLGADSGVSGSPQTPIVPPTLPPLDSYHISRGEDTLVDLELDSPQLASEGGYDTTRSQETLVGPSHGDFSYGEDSSNLPDRRDTHVPPGGGLSWSNPYLWSVWREYRERQSAAQPEESV